ncbi:MAG: 50S ribosomal protein L17 [Proteobacteria bacterium]|nr:50S ribosomal protein L17 [Pseudomonadota bacterium]
MRHQRRYRKLGRDSAHRRSMLRNLATGFFVRTQLVTTVSRAKEIQPIIEKLITQALKANKGNFRARRKVMEYLHPCPSPFVLFKTLEGMDVEHQGGRTRITRMGHRRAGDGAEMAVLTLVDHQAERQARQAPALSGVDSLKAPSQFTDRSAQANPASSSPVDITIDAVEETDSTSQVDGSVEASTSPSDIDNTAANSEVTHNQQADDSKSEETDSDVTAPKS